MSESFLSPNMDQQVSQLSWNLCPHPTMPDSLCVLFNLVNTNIHLNYVGIFSTFRAVNIFQLSYKNKSVSAV